VPRAGAEPPGRSHEQVRGRGEQLRRAKGLLGGAIELTSAPDPSAAKELVRRAMDAWSQGDTRSLEEILVPGFRQHNEEGGSWDRDEVLSLVRLFRVAFPDRATEFVHLVAEGELVAAHWTTHATHAGPYLDLSPTGTKVRAEGVAFFRCEGNRIAEVWNWTNSPSFYRQITGRAAPVVDPTRHLGPVAPSAPAGHGDGSGPASFPRPIPARPATP
jgi:predicted ester cyclase